MKTLRYGNEPVTEANLRRQKADPRSCEAVRKWGVVPGELWLRGVGFPRGGHEDVLKLIE